MLGAELSQLLEADRKYAVETGVTTFLRAAEVPEIELFKKIVGESPGFGPRGLFLVIGKCGRVFVSWPRDVEMMQHAEKDLRALLEAAVASGSTVLVVDPITSA